MSDNSKVKHEIFPFLTQEQFNLLIETGHGDEYEDDDAHSSPPKVKLVSEDGSRIWLINSLYVDCFKCDEVGYRTPVYQLLTATGLHDTGGGININPFLLCDLLHLMEKGIVIKQDETPLPQMSLHCYESAALRVGHITDDPQHLYPRGIPTL